MKPANTIRTSGRQTGWPLLVKRWLDIVVAVCGLAIVLPLLLVVGIAVVLTIGPPVLFRQQRTGRHGTVFTLIKFRSMADSLDSQGQLRPDKERLTRLGRLLRTTSLDEVPQLWNVLKGDLSLVGPRPLLVQYLERYTPQQARRHEVIPGITGWAQINGRNGLSWEEKFALDIWYVDNWTPMLDLKILILTAGKTILRSGISQKGHATMPEFTGDQRPAM